MLGDSSSLVFFSFNIVFLAASSLRGSPKSSLSSGRIYGGKDADPGGFFLQKFWGFYKKLLKHFQASSHIWWWLFSHKFKVLYCWKISRRVPTFGDDHPRRVWWVFHVHGVPRFKQGSRHCWTLLWWVISIFLRDKQQDITYMPSLRPNLVGVVVGNYKMGKDDPDEVESISLRWLR